MELGVAGTIRTEHIISSGEIHDYINEWLDDNPDIEVIDIKFSTSANPEDYSTDALIIYRKDE